jgi:hypothetical protein
VDAALDTPHSRRYILEGIRAFLERIERIFLSRLSIFSIESVYSIRKILGSKNKKINGH